MTTITIRSAAGRRVRTPAGTLLDGPAEVDPGIYWDRLISAGDVEIVRPAAELPKPTPANRAAVAADIKDR